MTSDFRSKNKNNFFFKKCIKENGIKFRNIKNSLKYCTIKINTNKIDKEISKRDLFLFDYIFIYLAHTFLIIKNYAITKPLTLIRGCKF